MKLLLDNNPSPKLVTKLRSLYSEVNHVSLLQLDRASDLEVWQFAHENNYCISSKDADFNDLLVSKGFPPKIIWIRTGNCTSAQVLQLLQQYHQNILEFFQDEAFGLLELI